MCSFPKLYLHAVAACLATLAALSASAAYQAPEILHAPSDDGVAHLADFQIGLAGAHDLNVWLVTGPTPTPTVPTQEICDNGVGDEVCGLLAVVTTTGGVTITGFAPESADIRGHLVSSRELRIAKLMAAGPNAGDLGPQRLGTLTVDRGSAGDVILSDASEVVRADLMLVGLVEDTIAVPEPAWGIQLLTGLLFLGAAYRLRRRRGSIAVSALAALALLQAAPASAQVYTDRTQFENALGDSEIQTEDFESIALDGNGFAAVSNGDPLGGGAFVWESQSASGDIDLYATAQFGGGDTGLDGTLLIGGFDGTTSVIGQPGGDGGHGDPAEDDDDFRLEFDPPVAAAGIEIGSNTIAGGEFLSFYDEEGNALAAITLINGFWGYVASTEGKRVAAIEVVEAADADDIFIDDIVWTEELEFDLDGFVPEATLRSWERLGGTSGSAGFGASASDHFGAGAANIGDLNDDGVVDVAIGMPGMDDGGTESGAVRVIFLERDGTTRGKSVLISDGVGGLPVGTLEQDDRFGRSVAPLGDLDGDGIPDIIVGADGETDDSREGRAFVLFMKRNGAVRASQEIGAGAGGFGGALAANDEFGSGVANLGDLDGDGVTDVAVGARYDSDGASKAGAVWILFLNSNGTVKDEQKISSTAGGFGGTLSAADEFGVSVAGIGDLDRDGIPDLAVGAWGDDGVGTDRGAVWILFLDNDGTVKSEVMLANDGTQGVPFGSLTFGAYQYGAAGNGDSAGYGLGWIPTPQLESPGVLAVGVPFFDSIAPISGAPLGDGAVFFLTLANDGSILRQGGFLRTVPPVGIPIPGAFDPPFDTSERLAGSVAPLGDLDGDTFPDVLVGTAHGGATDRGEAFVAFLGGFDPTSYGDDRIGPCACGAFSCQDSRILGAPDGSGVVIPDLGSITVQFNDNAARGDGTSATDLIFHREVTGATGSQIIAVTAAEATGPAEAVFIDVVGEDVEKVYVDLDAGGFGPSAQVRFVTVLVGSGGTSNCLTIGSDPSWDAVEVVGNRNSVFDIDFDGVVDGIDNCRYTPNVNQTDSDSDEVGDVCDNCPADPDFDQSDEDGDGFGDICDGGDLFLSEVTPEFSQPVWELSYQCPGTAFVDEVHVGIVLPSIVNPSTVHFGGPNAASSCEEPTPSVTIPNPPTGYVAGNGCTAATEMGALVDLNTSGVIGPGLSDPTGVRDDTLYVAASLIGCVANSTVSIGRLHYDAPTGTPPPQLTRRGVATPGLGLDEAVALYMLVDPNVGTVEMTLSPAPGETPGSETKWEFCVEAQGEINRLSIGFEASAGTTTGELKWLGCDTTPIGADQLRTCSAYATQYASHVATSCAGSACPSYTEGPVSTDSIPALYVVLEGNSPSSEPPLVKLNDANQSTCLGQVELNSTPGVPPDISLDGLEFLPNQPPIAAAVDSLPPYGVPDEVSTIDVAVASANGAGSEDTDNDSVRDEDDNCRYLANTSQTNTGGLLSSIGNDGIGDDCQCGDLDFDGRMLQGGNDVDLMVDVLLGINTNPAVRDRASVIDGPEPSIRDAVFLQRGLEGDDPGITQACEDALLPVP